jgi:hypothetical protein
MSLTPVTQSCDLACAPACAPSHSYRGVVALASVLGFFAFCLLAVMVAGFVSLTHIHVYGAKPGVPQAVAIANVEQAAPARPAPRPVKDSDWQKDVVKACPPKIGLDAPNPCNFQK